MSVARTLRRNDEHHQDDQQRRRSSSVSSTSCSEARIVGVRSRTTARSMAAGSEACELRQQRAHAVDGLDDVGARAAEQRPPARRGLPLASPRGAQVLDRVLDAWRRRRAARRAVAVGDDQRPVLRRRRAADRWSRSPTSRSPSVSWPFGRLDVGRCSARCARPRGRGRSGSAPSGFTSTRTAGSELPPTNTCPTPSICESFCCRIDAAASYSRPVLIVSEVSARIRIGASAGLTLR